MPPAGWGAGEDRREVRELGRWLTESSFLIYLDIVLAAMEDAFARTDEAELISILETLMFNTKRNQGEPIANYVSRMQTAIRKAQARRINLP